MTGMELDVAETGCENRLQTTTTTTMMMLHCHTGMLTDNDTLGLYLIHSAHVQQNVFRRLTTITSDDAGRLASSVSTIRL